MTTDSKNPYSATPSDSELQSHLIRSSDGMGVDFEMAPEDLEAFFQFHYLKKGEFRRAYLRRWLTLGIVFVALGLVFAFGSIDFMFGKMVGSMVILFGVVYTIFFPWIYRRRIKRLSEIVLKSGQNLSLSGCQRLRFVPKGILQNNPAGEFLHYWACVEAIERTASHAFFYVSGLSAVILPLRVFSSEEDYNEMLEFAEQHANQPAND